MKLIRAFEITALLAVFGAAAAFAQQPDAKPTPAIGFGKFLKVGDEAADFTAPAWGGGDVTLSKLKGKVVLIDFWASWCGPCKASLPHVQNVYEKLKGKGLNVIALASFDKKAEYEAYLTENKQFTLPFAHDPLEKGAGNIPTKYGVSIIPALVVVDREGKIAAQIVGYGGEKDRRLEDALAKLGLVVDPEVK